MAAKKPVEGERKYVIPLRREFNKVPGYRKTSKAVKAIRNFISKHMRVEEVKISNSINQEIWKHGKQNPPAKLEVKTILEDGYARVQLPNLDFDKKKEKKVSAPKQGGLAGKLQEKVDALKEDKKEAEVKKEEKKTSGEDTSKAQDKKPVKKDSAKTPKQPKAVRSY